ncbi:MAG: hypothetical protein ACRYHA_30960 [Janthinobacterium lividum]
MKNEVAGWECDTAVSTAAPSDGRILSGYQRDFVRLPNEELESFYRAHFFAMLTNPAANWYFRFQLSFRCVEAGLRELGVATYGASDVGRKIRLPRQGRAMLAMSDMESRQEFHHAL